eukprot:456645-Pyramimonas_sp.AAC.1
MHGPRPAPQTRGQRRAECTVQDKHTHPQCLLKGVGRGEQCAQSQESGTPARGSAHALISARAGSVHLQRSPHIISFRASAGRGSIP